MRNQYTILKTKNYKKKFAKPKKNNLTKIIITYILIISFFILLIIIYFKKSSSKTKINQNQFYTNESFIINSNNESLEISQILNSNESIARGNYTGGKLYWNNQKYINLDKIKEEIRSFDHFQISLGNSSDFIKREKPKVSVVITVHNQEKNVKTIYYSIQKQDLKDIEIIFVDDNSNDNTSMIIKEIMNFDKRIVYLKNEENKKAFYSRNKGILNAKGEYILVVDPDDLVLNNILLKSYITAKKYDLDMVHFYAMMGYYNRPNLWRNLKNKDGILRTNAAVRNNFYYTISRNLWDKLVRREVFVKSVEFMKEQFKNELYFLNNDDTAFFGLIHVAESYGFLEEVGYFYILRPRGTLCYRNDPKNSDFIIRSIFNNMNYFFIQSDDNKEDKIFMAYNYFDKSANTLKQFLTHATNEFDYNFALNVLDLYLNCPYFNFKQKTKLNDIKSKYNARKPK